MKKIKLTTYDRVTLSLWLGGGSLKGNITQLRAIMGLMDKLELSKTEQASVGMLNLNGSVTWKDTDKTFTIELDDAEVPLLLSALDHEWAATRRTLEMLEKVESLKEVQSAPETAPSD
jgi:hypothetical protein